MENEDKNPLYLNGQPVPMEQPNLDVPAPDELPPPAIEPGDGFSLKVQLDRQTERLIFADMHIRGLESSIKEHYAKIRECHVRIRLRREFLKEKAADIVCRKNGVKTIDGYKNKRGSAAKARKLTMAKIKILERSAKLMLPAELQAEIDAIALKIDDSRPSSA